MIDQWASDEWNVCLFVGYIYLLIRFDKGYFKDKSTYHIMEEHLRTQGINWLGTIFLPDGSREEDYCNWSADNEQTRGLLKACRWQHEIGEEGRHHIQIFCSAKRSCRWQALDRALGLEANQRHWKGCSTPKHAQNAWDYCGEEKADGTRHGCPSKQWGDRPTCGGRGRLGGGSDTANAAMEFIRGRKREAELLLEENAAAFEVALKHPAGFKWLRSIAERPSNRPDEWRQRRAVCFYGGAGLGKSRRVREECAAAGLSLWVSTIGPTGRWFDGYDNHDCVLFDDFDGGMPFRDLLNLLEGNVLQVPVKGGFVRWSPSVVYFTSDVHPRDWTFDFNGDGKRQGLNDARLAQLLRRFGHIEPIQAPPEQLLVVLGEGGGLNTIRPPPEGAAFSNLLLPPLFAQDPPVL